MIHHKSPHLALAVAVAVAVAVEEAIPPASSARRWPRAPLPFLFRAPEVGVAEMARRIRSYRRNSSRKFRFTPYPLPSCQQQISEKEGQSKKTSSNFERKDWKGATCPVCMEFPHNAVLLLCSSHDKGCRPYMCATSYRYSNCLEQFKKAYATTTSVMGNQNNDLPAWKKSNVTELACPLCRGQVKGWTVVEPAREYLNKKRRSCTQDNCSFTGNYKETRKHVKTVHPCAKPHAVDPVLEQKWKTLEHQRERADVISTIRSSMPRSVILGDYVIEMADSDSGSDDYDDDFFDDANEIFDRQNGRSIFSALLREAARHRRFSRSHVPEIREGHPAIVDHASLDSDGGGSAIGRVHSERQQHRQRGYRRSVHGSRLL
ncbi:hypothetical protein Cni_G11527 [Canna indica]|uniref:Uncharacterized protein n=1 Tax=Canna indica TaxID=4628 RepID=A0AAQ3K686_9LILI|nr:hypothetical protein Cni_G11527 [Canna indica]